MKKLARFIGFVAGLGTVAYMLRDRLVSLAAPREPEPPRFKPITPAAVLPAAADDLTEINGIGPVYADRLSDEGITTFAQLAGQDAARLAQAIDVAESRVAGWIEEAGGR